MPKNCTHNYRNRRYLSCEELGLGKGTFAQMPIPRFEKGILEVFFTSRDDQGRSIPYAVELEPHTFKIIRNSKVLSIPLGELGTFDQDGVMPSALLETSEGTHLYYIGWERSFNTPYRLSIGLAIRQKNRETFSKFSNGPILDRSISNPHFSTTPFVYKSTNRFEMIFSNGNGWINHEGKLESIYNLMTAESSDGLLWENFKLTPVEINADKCNARPHIFESHLYLSQRPTTEFRTKGNGYRIHAFQMNDKITYNECELTWDTELEPDGDKSYSSIIMIEGIRYIFFNSESFGKNGFHIAQEVITSK